MAMASFRKCISTGIPNTAKLDPSCEVRPTTVVKKKLCRVSKGYANAQNLLKLNETNESAESAENFQNKRVSDGVAKEICGDHLVEISVVRGNQIPDSTDKPDNTSPDAQLLIQNSNNKGVELGGNARWSSAILADESNKLLYEPQRKRVAFSDAIVVHSFENEEDNYDSNSENMYEIDDEPSTVEQNDIAPTEVYRNSVNNIHIEAQLLAAPKKIPLRRLVFGQVTRACNKTNLFRSLLRDSFRRPISSAPRGRTTVARTKSLVDRSVRHSFINVEDPNGTHVQLVVPLGPHYMPNGVSVTASGDGKKIKVLAIRKRAAEEGSISEVRKHDYHECFYLPMAINPLMTKATVDSDGHLKIEAPFATSNPSDICFDILKR